MLSSVIRSEGNRGVCLTMMFNLHLDFGSYDAAFSSKSVRMFLRSVPGLISIKEGLLTAPSKVYSSFEFSMASTLISMSKTLRRKQPQEG